MTTTRRFTTTAVATALAAALSFSLAACSGSDGGAGATPSSQTATQDGGEHNDADAQFAQMMIVHHQGAIEMADLALKEATTPEVRALAQRIADAQGPEIELMSGWLVAWGEDQPADMAMPGMDHGGMDMGGLDQEEAMSDLSGLSGPAFDKRFLELMTEHHQGAVDMSKAEQTDGRNADAVDLAGSIIEAQTAEIGEMASLAADL